jgi:Flp pilus assembly CpaF family ATPase
VTGVDAVNGSERVNGRRPQSLSGQPGWRAGAAGTDSAARDSVVDWAVVGQLRAAVAARLQAERGRSDRAGLSGQDERMLAAALVGEEIERWAVARAAAGLPALGRAAERALAEAVTAALFGLGRLQPLLDREDVENILIEGHDKVTLQLAGGREEPAGPIAGSDAELVELLAGWAARAGQTGREFSPAQPMLNLRLPGGGPLGARLAAVMEVTPRPRVAIRRHRLTHVNLDDLAGLGTVSRPLAEFLRAAVRAGLNMVVSGAPAVGKTTLLRALAAEIPAGEHVVTVEAEYELGLRILHPDRLVTPMETRQANAEGAGEIDLHALLTQALRHSPSRVLVGEVRGGEVTALLLALSNGAAGGMCTLHAASAAAVLTRIAQLALLSRPPLPAEAAWRFTADAVDLIVHLDRDHTGRYVSEVLEVGGVGDAGLPDTTLLFGPRESEGRAAPACTPSVRLRRRLTRAGFDRAWFTAATDPSGRPDPPAGARR